MQALRKPVQLLKYAAFFGWGCAELLKQVSLVTTEVCGSVNDDSYNVSTARFAAHVWDAVGRKLKVAPTLCAGWYFHAHEAIDRIDFYFGAECCVYHADVLFAEYKVAFAREAFVSFDADVDIEVALGAICHCFAVLSQANGCTVIDAGGDFELHRLAFALRAGAAANATDFFWHLTPAFAIWANGGLLYVAKYSSDCSNYLPITLTRLTSFKLMAWFYGGAFAVFTGVIKV